MRSGNLVIRNSSFQENGAQGGESGGTPATDGIGKGGAIFALNTLTNSNGNNNQMPPELPRVIGCENLFLANTVDPPPPNTDTDNADTFGTSRAALIAPCPPPAGVPVLGGVGKWLLAALLALGGVFGLAKRRH